MGYLAEFIHRFKWWDLYPAPDLLVEQPGDDTYNHFVPVVRSSDNKTIIAYLPVRLSIRIRKPADIKYRVRWFDPARNEYYTGTASDDGITLSVTSVSDSDMLLILDYVPEIPSQKLKKGRIRLLDGTAM
jgi:hypothetical protein